MMTKALLLVALLLAATASANAGHLTALRSEFEAFKAKYHKKYPTKQNEEARFATFVANVKKAGELQKANPLATFGVNEFADLTEAEFKRYHNAEQHYARRARTQPVEDTTLASAAGKKIDWRAKGAVTAVKNQGQCGSCWTFSATGNIEGQHFLKHGKLVSLSEQEIVSCDTLGDGCNGGLMDLAFEWLIQSRGGNIDTEASYPYASGSGTAPACRLTGRTVGAKISSYKDIAHTETAIANAVYSLGPISVAVDATSWQTYQGGILTNCISQQVDHGVLVVGFDDEYSTPYWIIKNSWAASWGEDGYIRVAKGSDQCLITTAPSTAVSA
jgi:cysteine peptidase B